MNDFADVFAFEYHMECLTVQFGSYVELDVVDLLQTAAYVGQWVIIENQYAVAPRAVFVKVDVV